MRHGIAGKKLGRDKEARKALMNNLAFSLLDKEQILTTVPKAKALRPFVEKIISLGKKGDLSSRRKAFSFLRNDELVVKLFSSIAERYKERNGGFTRIVKAGFRKGDSAPIAIIELVDRDIEAKKDSDTTKEVKVESTTN